jgi:orotidine-5'-phosphate decarboxylase
MDNFAERLVDAVGATGPLCAGIDPSAELLHEWGLPDDAQGLRSFGARCVEAFGGVVPVVKPQVAFFERHGATGFAALEGLIAEAHGAGLLVIADAKRGDVGSTMDAYADAWLGTDSPLAVDAVTAHPYLGLGSLRPLFDAATKNGRGVFVVVRGSNPEGRDLQQSVIRGGASVEDSFLAELAGLNADSPGPLGPFGAVVGATLSPSSFPLPQVKGPFLSPGVGAQGGGPAEVATLFAGCLPGSVLPNVSRSLLASGPSIEALHAAAVAVRDELGAALS